MDRLNSHIYGASCVEESKDKESNDLLFQIHLSMGQRPIQIFIDEVEDNDENGNPCERTHFYYTESSLEDLREMLLSTDEMKDFVMELATEIIEEI